jgi:hypothetical protein
MLVSKDSVCAQRALSVRSACNRETASKWQIIPRKRYVVQTGVFRLPRCFESCRYDTAMPAYPYGAACRHVPALLMSVVPKATRYWPVTFAIPNEF